MGSRLRPPAGVSRRAFLEQGPSGRELAYVGTSGVQQGPISTIADLTDLTITFDVGDRPVYVEVLLPAPTCIGTASTFSFHITDESNAIKRTASVTPGANSAFGVVVRERISTPGTYTRKARAVRVAGSANLYNNATDATVVSSIRAVEA